MRIVFATDERTPVSEHIVERLRDAGHVVDVVANGDPWPDAGHWVGEAVAQGHADRGVVCCWTGTGVSIAANHASPEVRAALCVDAETARGARRWNNANVLALSLRLTTEAVADEILDAFLSTEPEEAERANFERA